MEIRITKAEIKEKIDYLYYLIAEKKDSMDSMNPDHESPAAFLQIEKELSNLIGQVHTWETILQMSE